MPLSDGQALDDRRQLGRLLKAAGLAASARFTAFGVWSHRNRETGYARCGLPALADIVGADEREVRRHIRAVEATEIMVTQARAGTSNLYFFPAFPPRPRGTGTPGVLHPPGHNNPGDQDPPGETHTPGVVHPHTPGVVHPPNPLDSETAAAAAVPADSEPHIVILRQKLAAAGLIVRWDRLDATELAEIVALVTLHGDDPLVRAAQQSRAAHGTPPAYAKAWLATWRSLPPPGQVLAVVSQTRTCSVPGHESERAASCGLCRGNAAPPAAITQIAQRARNRRRGTP